MRPAGRISLSWATQGFSRASTETREKIAPSFFARERNRAWRSRVSGRNAPATERIGRRNGRAGCSTLSRCVGASGSSKKRKADLWQTQSEGIDVHLSGVDNLRYLHNIVKNAVVYPPVSVVTENLSQVRSIGVRICLNAEHGIVDKQFCRGENIGVECVGVFGVEVAGNVVAGLLKCLYGVVRPLQCHTAILSACGEWAAAILSLRRLARLRIMRLTCSCDFTSPRMDCPSLMMKPSYG